MKLFLSFLFAQALTIPDPEDPKSGQDSEKVYNVKQGFIVSGGCCLHLMDKLYNSKQDHCHRENQECRVERT